MEVTLQDLEREVKRCSECGLTVEYRMLLDALDEVSLTQELVDYLCRMIVAKKYVWEIHFAHLRPLLLNPMAKQFDLKQFFAERFSRSRRLCMKMYFLRGYAMYACEEETSKLCSKFAQALSKNRDYIDYIYIMSEYGLQHLVRSYNYPCFVDAWAKAQSEYEKIHPHLHGYATTDARLRQVSLLSSEEVLRRQQLFIAELREKYGR